MRKLCAAALTVGLGLLAACGDKAPTGQVAAKVGKDEITVQEIQAELNGFNPSDPKARKQAEQQALQNIVQRKLLARAAEDAKVDRSPEFAVQKARMEEALLVQAWQNSLVQAVPEPSPEQVRQFIAQNPSLYANRRIFAVDQVRMSGFKDQKILDELKPLNTIEAIVGVLQAHGIQFQTGKGTLDTLTLDPKFVAQIDKLPPGEVFVVPVNNMFVANKIIESKPAPMSDDAAAKHAAQAIKAQQAQESVSRMFGAAVTNHPKVKVLYNKAYEPPAAPAKAAAAEAAGEKKAG